MTAFATVQPLRPAQTVMQLERLGALFPYPLSFMRCLIRRMATDGWTISRQRFDLDAEGYGEAIYRIDVGNTAYHFVVFSHYLDDALRSDRVIAEQWDMTATLCTGELTKDRLDRLRANVPLQEAGRLDPDCIVLTRANKSGRNFETVISALANGQQPDLTGLARVGYLFRTTAVYGSGKFGMADWQKICRHHSAFARPFMAEMLSCYLIRHFSLELADWLALQRGGSQAASLDGKTKRMIGVGNATGLGMSPYLITHPALISNWITVRETALARIMERDSIAEDEATRFMSIARQAITHLAETETADPDQDRLNYTARREVTSLLKWFERHRLKRWSVLAAIVENTCTVQTQELVNSILLEVHRDLILDLETRFTTEERYDLVPHMSLSALKTLLETHYEWALEETYDEPDALATFWYRSEEKMEPRLGLRHEEPGADREMLLGIGQAVSDCYNAIVEVIAQGRDPIVAEFVLQHPQYRYIIRRAQSMAKTGYGEIQTNLLHARILPIHLLRCKLSFFGVGKFDPKSRFWVRNVMFQGAPLIDDLAVSGSDPLADDWYFPVSQDG